MISERAGCMARFQDRCFLMNLLFEMSFYFEVLKKFTSICRGERVGVYETSTARFKKAFIINTTPYIYSLLLLTPEGTDF